MFVDKNMGLFSIILRIMSIIPRFY